MKYKKHERVWGIYQPKLETHTQRYDRSEQ